MTQVTRMDLGLFTRITQVAEYSLSGAAVMRERAEGSLPGSLGRMEDSARTVLEAIRSSIEAGERKAPDEYQISITAGTLIHTIKLLESMYSAYRIGMTPVMFPNEDCSWMEHIPDDHAFLLSILNTAQAERGLPLIRRELYHEGWTGPGDPLPFVPPVGYEDRLIDDVEMESVSIMASSEVMEVCVLSVRAMLTALSDPEIRPAHVQALMHSRGIPRAMAEEVVSLSLASLRRADEMLQGLQPSPDGPSSGTALLEVNALKSVFSAVDSIKQGYEQLKPTERPAFLKALLGGHSIEVLNEALEFARTLADPEAALEQDGDFLHVISSDTFDLVTEAAQGVLKADPGNEDAKRIGELFRPDRRRMQDLKFTDAAALETILARYAGMHPEDTELTRRCRSAAERFRTVIEKITDAPDEFLKA